MSIERKNQFFLSAEKPGLMNFPGITPETTKTANDLLQKNHDELHGFFDSRKFHNHIVHAILACWDFGASSSTLQAHYDREKHNQRPKPNTHPEIITKIADPEKWDQFAGKDECYSDFLEFLQKEMEETGYEQMINKRLFGRDGKADELLAKCFAGLYHPLIQIGYGLEFGLPALIPEGIAMAVADDPDALDFLLKCEQELEAPADKKTLRELLDGLYNDPRIRKITAENPNPIHWKTLLASSPAPIIHYARQFNVPVDQIEQKIAESINLSAQIVGGAIRADKAYKLDFFLVHSLTTSIFLTTFNAQPWLSAENKARLVEWKTRFDFFLYVAMGAPPLLLSEVENYTPKIPHSINASAIGSGSTADNADPWLGIIERGIRKEDDGHTVKTIRALAHGAKVCGKYPDGKNGMLMKKDMWAKLAEMCIDASEDIENGSAQWVFGAGFDSAWEGFGPRRTY